MRSLMNKKAFFVFGFCICVFLFITGCGNSTKPSNIIEIEDDYVWESDEYTVKCVPSPTGKGGDMCFVPEGEFKQGCNEAIDDECGEAEYPFHKVLLSSYWIDKYEVTAEEYEKCIDAGACNNNDKESPHYGKYRVDDITDYKSSCNIGNSENFNHPANCVSWYGAEAYCKWVGKRLPSEAEWEKASRGTDGRRYPWGNEAVNCDYAVMREQFGTQWGCGEYETWDVGKKELGKSPYGCYDMAGNVYEWVNDWFVEDYYELTIYLNPSGPESSYGKVIRGGSFIHQKRQTRSSWRYFDLYWSETNQGTIGFRCVKSVDD
jgi:formylglycine-generating enzyme required for sulfatase activity